MAIGDPIPDKTLLRNVDQKLARRGAQSSRVKATVRSGDVTLTGTIAFEHERRPLVKTAGSVPGVKRVIDQLKVVPKRTAQQ